MLMDLLFDFNHVNLYFSFVFFLITNNVSEKKIMKNIKKQLQEHVKNRHCIMFAKSRLHPALNQS